MNIDDDGSNIFQSSEITPEDEIQSLEFELEAAYQRIEYLTQQNKLNADALKLLIKICQEAGFNAFPEIKVPALMTKEELLNRNKQVKHNRVFSKEASVFPTHEELMERYKPSEQSEKLVNTILNMSKNEVNNEIRRVTK